MPSMLALFACCRCGAASVKEGPKHGEGSQALSFAALVGTPSSSTMLGLSLPASATGRDKETMRKESSGGLLGSQQSRSTWASDGRGSGPAVSTNEYATMASPTAGLATILDTSVRAGAPPGSPSAGSLAPLGEEADGGSAAHNTASESLLARMASLPMAETMAFARHSSWGAQGSPTANSTSNSPGFHSIQASASMSNLQSPIVLHASAAYTMVRRR